MPDAAKIITEGFLQGAFSVFDAMLSKPFTHTPQEPAALTEGQLEELLGQHPPIRFQIGFEMVYRSRRKADFQRLSDLLVSRENLVGGHTIIVAVPYDLPS